jgi:FixJ family two-component response regulator
MNTSDRFVVLSADKALIKALSAALPADVALQVVDSLAALPAALRASDTRGVVVDGQLVGTQTALSMERVRNLVPLAQLLFVAVDLRAHVLNELQPLRVDIVARPLPPQAFSMFVERALRAGRLPSASVNAYIDHLASAHRLSRKEVSLFSVVLENETAEQACARLGFDELVFSRTMRRLLKKCHMRSADRLAKSVMRDALLSCNTLTASMVEPFRPAVGF